MLAQFDATALDDFIRQEFAHPNFLPGGYFLAFDGRRPVGMTNFVKQGGNQEILATSITGVLSSHRRRASPGLDDFAWKWMSRRSS